jgi:hypothetical protein
MQIINFRSMSIDELLALKEKIAYILPAQVNAQKLKQQKHGTRSRAKLWAFLGSVAQIPRLIAGLRISTRRARSDRVAASSRIARANCSPMPKRWMMSGSFGLAEGRKLGSRGLTEERIIWRTRFQGQIFDLRGKAVLTRFDCCEFVKCTLLMDQGTEQLIFTECAFKDCNIDQLAPNEQRGLYVRDNVFHRPLEERRAQFETKLAQALARRKHATLRPHRPEAFMRAPQ